MYTPLLSPLQLCHSRFMHPAIQTDTTASFFHTTSLQFSITPQTLLRPLFFCTTRASYFFLFLPPAHPFFSLFLTSEHLFLILPLLNAFYLTIFRCVKFFILSHSPSLSHGSMSNTPLRPTLQWALSRTHPLFGCFTLLCLLSLFHATP